MFTQIRYLTFEDTPETRIDAGEWALVLPAMVHLRHLAITHAIPLERETIPHITFRLTFFASCCSVVGAWADFLATQSDLTEIALTSDLFANLPGTAHLPNLVSVTGRPEELSKFTLHYSTIEDLWFWPGPPRGRRNLVAADLGRFSRSLARLSTLRIRGSQFLKLLDAAPALLSGLQALTLDEENGWHHFSAEVCDILVLQLYLANQPQVGRRNGRGQLCAGPSLSQSQDTHASMHSTPSGDRCIPTPDAFKGPGICNSNGTVVHSSNFAHFPFLLARGLCHASQLGSGGCNSSALSFV